MKTQLFFWTFGFPMNVICTSRYINQQTMHFLCFLRREETGLKPLHGTKVTIWCTTLGYEISGSHFTEGKDGNTWTINEEHNQTLVLTCFLSVIKHLCHIRNMCLRMKWFQQDSPYSPSNTGHGAFPGCCNPEVNSPILTCSRSYTTMSTCGDIY